MTDVEAQWTKALGEDVEIFTLGEDQHIVHIAGVFHGMFRTLAEAEWELDAIYQARDEEK